MIFRSHVKGVAAAFSMLCAGCAGVDTAPEETRATTTYTTPLEESVTGILLVPVRINDGPTEIFLVDSASTVSGILPSAATAAAVDASAESYSMVRGMFATAQRPVTETVSMVLGDSYTVQTQLVILDGTLPGRATGLIGLDVLEDAAIVVGNLPDVMEIYPGGLPTGHPARSWQRLPLYEDPLSDRSDGLHFLKSNVGTETLYALLDTGAVFSAMNWTAGNLMGDLTSIRRNLRRSWIAEGAIGEFRPTTFINLSRLAFGRYQWVDINLLVFDFIGLDAIGAGTRPMMILGAPMLKDRRYAIDLANDVLYIHRKKVDTEQ